MLKEGMYLRGNVIEKYKNFKPLMEMHCLFKTNLLFSNLVAILSCFDETDLNIKFFLVLLMHSNSF